MSGIPFIHLFQTYGDYYLYDINRNTVLKTDPKVWHYLKSEKSVSGQAAEEGGICQNTNKTGDGQPVKEDQEYIDSKVKRMKENGFLSSNQVKEVLHETDEVLEDYIENKIVMINLQVTQQCNLRCDYCPYSGGYDHRSHSSQRMTLEMAEKGIDFLIAHSSGMRDIAVGFYGGEPLLEFELIKKIVAYTEKKAAGKNILYTVTTNATLINMEIARFLKDYSFHTLISLDGPREIHDENRRFVFNQCGTFDKVIENVSMIKEAFPEYMKLISYNAVSDPQNSFTCISKFFNDFEAVKEEAAKYSEISPYYLKTEVNSSETYFTELNYEYFKVFLNKLGKLDQKYISKLVTERFDHLGRLYRYLCRTEKLPEKMHHGGPCIPGVHRLFLNACGIFYPCEKVSETSETTIIGDIENGLDLSKIRTILNVGKLTEDQCRKCWAFRFCILCVAASDDGKGLSGELKEKRCNGTRNLIDGQLKDICMMKEFGFKMEES